MRNIILLFIVVISYSSSALAQIKTPEFEALKLNSSPAFVILGIEPDNIQRPTSPTQFIAGLQNSIINQKLKPNVAFEITPYYLKNPAGANSKHLSETHFMLNPERSFFNTIKRSFSISFATSESDSVVFGKLDPGIGIGTGIKFLVVDGKPSERIKEWNKKFIENVFYESLEAQITALPVSSSIDINLILTKALRDFKSTSVKNLDYNGFSSTELDNLLNNFKNDIVYDLTLKNIKKTRNDLKNYFETRGEELISEQESILKDLSAKKNPLAKMGFMLEFAGGGAMVLENNKWSEARKARAAFWLTPSYRIDISKDGRTISLFDFMGVFRYTVNNKKDSIDASDYFDFGLKGQFIRSKWSGSLEWVFRKATEKPKGLKKDHTYRLVSSLDYKLNDIITFKFSFGTNFDGNTATYTKTKEIFAVGGLNLGIFNPEKK